MTRVHVPVGDMSPWPAAFEVCRCGALLTLRPNVRNEWDHVDQDGRTWVDEGPPGGVLAYLDVLSEGGLRDDARAQEYSSLLAAWQLNPLLFHHVHRPVTVWPNDEPPARDSPPPECCGQPMRWAPSGWVCRA